ncbi:hypothetical protein ACQP2E_12115 [Actinoplanes sp. CA-015351]|uniref:hypothetical protein n=1 Tax=Actinoplanes sp. CA-015351 TaxID=3239897 RepID=UPI003D99928B
MTVHQLMFRWAEMTLTGNKGVGPVASSMDLEQTSAWRARLESEIWAATRPGMSYLESHGAGVVVHKLPVNDNNDRPGSTLTHVLIGRPEDLGAQFALGLTDWHGWIREGGTTPEGGRLPVLDAAQIAADAERGLRQLRPRAREVLPGPLEQLVRAVLDDPATPLSVLAGSLPAAEVLCGMIDLLGPAYGPWTFATADAGDDGAGRPRIVFLDRAPERVSARNRIKLGWDAQGDDFLAAYTEAYRRGGLRAVGPVRPPAVFTKAKDIANWERDAQVVPGVLNSPFSLLLRAGRAALTEAELEYVGRPRTVDELAGLLPRLSDQELTEVVQEWAAPEGREQSPDLADRVTDVAVQRIILVPQRSAELAVATEALAPSPDSVHRAVEAALSEIRGHPEPHQIKRRIGLLRVVTRLGVPYLASNPTIALILSGISGPTLITLIATSSPETPRLTELLLGDLRRVRAEGNDARPVFEAMRQHRLLLPVLLRSRSPAEAVPMLRDLLAGMFGPLAGAATTIEYLLAGFPPNAVPAAALAALALVADSEESVRLLGETSLRQQLAADGIELRLPPPKPKEPSQQQGPAPMAAIPVAGPRPAPVRPDRAATATGEFAERSVWPLVATVGLVFVLVVVFGLLFTYR